MAMMDDGVWCAGCCDDTMMDTDDLCWWRMYWMLYGDDGWLMMLWIMTSMSDDG